MRRDDSCLASLAGNSWLWDILKFLASAAEFGLALACGHAVGDLTAAL